MALTYKITPFEELLKKASQPKAPTIKATGDLLDPDSASELGYKIPTDWKLGRDITGTSLISPRGLTWRKTGDTNTIADFKPFSAEGKPIKLPPEPPPEPPPEELDRGLYQAVERLRQAPIEPLEREFEVASPLEPFPLAQPLRPITPPAKPQQVEPMDTRGRLQLEEGISLQEFKSLTGMTLQEYGVASDEGRVERISEPGETLMGFTTPEGEQRVRIRDEALSLHEKILRYQAGTLPAEALPQPLRAWVKGGEAVTAAGAAPLFEVAGVPISAFDITALALISFGIYQVGTAGWNTLLNKVLRRPGDLNWLGKQLTKAGLNRNLDIFERQYKVKIPTETRNNFINRYLNDMAASWERMVGSQVQQGTANIQSLQLASQAAYARTVDIVNREIQTLIPGATATGITMGGLPPEMGGATIQSVVAKIVANQSLNLEERQLYANQSQAVEDALQTQATPEVTPPTVPPVTPEVPAVGEVAPIIKPPTKATQLSISRVERALVNIEELAPKEIVRESAVRRKQLANAYESLELHARKLGVPIPRLGTFYNPEQYLSNARQMSEAVQRSYQVAPTPPTVTPPVSEGVRVVPKLSGAQLRKEISRVESEISYGEQRLKAKTNAIGQKLSQAEIGAVQRQVEMDKQTLAGLNEQLVVTPQPSPEAPQAITRPITEEVSAIPSPEVTKLAEQLKAKLAAEPVVKPPSPKSPVERRAEIKSLLTEPAQNLPKGTTKIALRKELGEINKALIPQEKALRQKIMATVKGKALTQPQYRNIFKDVGGSRQLSTIGLPELNKVLTAVQRARPKKIGGKTVITQATEQLIRDTRASLLESGKLKEADYPAILRVLGLKTDKYVGPQNFITNRQGLNIIKAMKRKSQIGFATLEEVVNEIVTTLGPPSKVVTPITKASFDVPWASKMGGKINSFLVRTYRVERILDKLDAEERGIMWRTFYKPLNDATSQKVQGVSTKLEEFRGLLKENNIDLGKLMGDKVEIQPGLLITPSEKIGVYLSSLNPDNLKHLKEGNKFTDATIETIKGSLTEQEKQVADWLKTYYENEHPAISEAKLYVTDEPLSKVENYFPIRLQYRNNPVLDYWEQVAKEDNLNFISGWASKGIPKGFTKVRTHEATQAVDLDAMSIFLNHLEAVEHYKAFAPAIADLQLIMKNPNFKGALIGKTNNATYQVIDKWLKQVAEVNPMRPTNQAEAILRTLRVNATTAVLGVNLTTAMKQFPSFASGASEIGLVPAINGLFTFLHHPIETRQLIKQYSPQIYHRTFEREIAEAQRMRGAGKIIAGKMSARQVFMFMTTTMDKTAVSSLWRGAFDSYLSKHIDDVKGAAEYADAAIRKTQPFFDVKDLPEYYRSGEFMKALLVFTNQLNQYWNYYHFDIAGKYGAGRISTLDVLKRILLTFVIPALMIGAITRSRLPKKPEEVGEDLAGMAVATIPLAGSWISSGMKGFTDNSLITTELADEIALLSNRVTNGKWDKMWESIVSAGGYATGVPIAQPKRTIKGMIDLATGKTDDWLRLIWSSYARERAIIPLEEAQEIITESQTKLGKFDQAELDAKLEEATEAKASPARIREIKAEDYLYDITSLRRDIGDATRNLSEKDITKLEPIATNYVELKAQTKEYDLLSDEEQEQYVRDNPDYTTNRLFWGGITTIPDLKTAKAIEAQAKKYDIPLDMIPAFQLTDKGQERIPSNQGLWQPYFTYNDLPSSSYLALTQGQVDAGRLPEEYRKEWETYQKLLTDTAKSAFRNGHKEVSYSKWRDDFRRANSEFDQWLQDEQGLKPLSPKVTAVSPAISRARSGATSIKLAGAEGFGLSTVSPRRAKATYPTFPKPKTGISIKAPGVPGF